MSGGWVTLPAPRFHPDWLDRIDPYLWLADALNYADHGGAAPARYGLLLQRKPNATAPSWDGWQPTPAHAESAFLTGTADLAGLQALLADRAQVARLQFANALQPQRAARPWPAPGLQAGPRPAHPAGAGPALHGHVLLACVDTGCPFAHRAFRDANRGTRIVRLWDQGSGADHAGLGAAPARFGYGRELTRLELQTLMNTATLHGSIDESACYRLAGYSALFGHGSHGAHTLGLLAGAGLPNGRPTGSPRPMETATVAADADIVFVQFPQALMQCVSVAALERHTYDAMRYALDCAMELGYPEVALCFGYESWVGPHDGSSWFEAAVDDLIASAHAPRLSVYTIAGNSKHRQAHLNGSGTHAQLDATLWLPPDHEQPTFVEIWVPAGHDALALQLTPPGEQTALPPLGWGATGAWPSARAPAVSVVAPPVAARVLGQHASLMLLRLAPTRSHQAGQAPAAAGRWRLRLTQVDGKPVHDIHAYIGRSQPTLDTATTARQACWVDRSTTEAANDRRGTLNGHAGGGRVHVSAAHQPASFPYLNRLGQPLRGRATRYSGSGPSRQAGRSAPDDSVAVEDGLYHPGVLSIGNTSASHFRMSGTSAAAPWRARIAVEQAAADIGPRRNTPQKKPGTKPVDPELGGEPAIDPWA